MGDNSDELSTSSGDEGNNVEVTLEPYFNNHVENCEFCKLRDEYDMPPDKKEDSYLGFVNKKYNGKQIKTKLGPLKLKKLIARGGEALVFETEFNDDADRKYGSVVVKIGDCKNEIEVVKKIKCDSIIVPVDSGKMSVEYKGSLPVYYIVYPMMCCCLNDLDDKELAIIGILQIAKTVNEIHTQRIIHNDISPVNIMIKAMADGNVKFYLIDLGMAKPYEYKLTIAPEYKNEGNLDFMSKEQHKGFKYRPYKSDYQNYFFSLYSLFEKLPWRHQEKPSEVYQMKVEFCPRYFGELYNKIMELEFGSKLDLYEETKNALGV
jgi:serine/threonine protein kinase